MQHAYTLQHATVVEFSTLRSLIAVGFSYYRDCWMLSGIGAKGFGLWSRSECLVKNARLGPPSAC